LLFESVELTGMRRLFKMKKKIYAQMRIFLL